MILQSALTSPSFPRRQPSPQTASPASASTPGMAADRAQFSAPSGVAPYRVSQGNAVQPLVDKRQVLPAVMDAINHAQKSILLQSYLFGGQVSMQIAQALVKKQQEGLDVRVVLDPKLSIVGADDKQAAINYLKANGVEVRTFPTQALAQNVSRLHRGNPIDHAKMVVVDGSTAIAGGMNLSTEGVEAHDFMVKLQGPAATQFADMFNQDWELSGGEKVADPRPAKAVGSDTVAIAESSPTTHNISPLVLSQINGARKSIAIEALFLNQPEYVQALIAAHKRGVDVQVLLDQSAVKKFAKTVPGGSLIEGLPVGTLPNLPAIADLRAAGIPVHLYDPHDGLSYLHGKLAVIDDHETLLGSANFTSQATTHNREDMMAIEDPTVAKHLMAGIESDWSHHSTNVQTLPGWQEKLAPIVGGITNWLFPTGSSNA